MMKKLYFLLALAGVLTSCSSESTSSENTSSGNGTQVEMEEISSGYVQSIDSEEAKILIEDQKNLIILDVRTQKEYDEGHVKDALHIDFYSPDFSQHLLALDPNKSYMVYCAVGGRSSKAVDMMEKLGFKQLYGVSEGFPALKNAGVPVENAR